VSKRGFLDIRRRLFESKKGLLDIRGRSPEPAQAPIMSKNDPPPISDVPPSISSVAPVT
jgi:hypothetical protein